MLGDQPLQQPPDAYAPALPPRMPAVFANMAQDALSRMWLDGFAKGSVQHKMEAMPVT